MGAVSPHSPRGERQLVGTCRYPACCWSPRGSCLRGAIGVLVGDCRGASRGLAGGYGVAYGALAAGCWQLHGKLMAK
jgi:hypothetical protein